MAQFKRIVAGIVAACAFGGGAIALAQAKVTTVPDAQVESDVLKALAANPKLADQTITSTTVYGTVTLSGSVRDEDSRVLAETTVSRTPGVQKVVDELTLTSDKGAASQNAVDPAATGDNAGSNPLLQSDGTLASPQQQETPGRSSQTEQSVDPRSQQSGPPPQPSRQTPYGQQPGYNQPPYNQPGYGQPNDDQAQGQSAGQPPPQQAPYGPPYRRPYGQPGYPPPPANYPQQQQRTGPAPYGAQEGGLPVTVPSGSMLRVRINQGLDSKHTQPGTVFDAVVLNDVVAGGFVAIPRGASVQGTVVEAEQAGALKGRGELSLLLTQLSLAGRNYPITSDTWSRSGGDKTSRTVNSALGLGAVGAIIGGVAGGGGGAAIGAGLGGAAGVGASAASGGGQVIIPSEAILTFHLTQPADLKSVSQAEMDRLSSGVPVGAQMRRRYPPPPPPYGYPVYYPRYPYPY